jgi:catechol 2,3-dioxygenase-like lactoylglutathione lyase family enzyme
MGFNHICLAVDDIDAAVRRLSGKLAFLLGPEGVTVELAQWMAN